MFIDYLSNEITRLKQEIDELRVKLAESQNINDGLIELNNELIEKISARPTPAIQGVAYPIRQKRP